MLYGPNRCCAMHPQAVPDFVKPLLGEHIEHLGAHRRRAGEQHEACHGLAELARVLGRRRGQNAVQTRRRHRREHVVARQRVVHSPVLRLLVAASVSSITGTATARPLVVTRTLKCTSFCLSALKTMATSLSLSVLYRHAVRCIHSPHDGVRALPGKPPLLQPARPTCLMPFHLRCRPPAAISHVDRCLACTCHVPFHSSAQQLVLPRNMQLSRRHGPRRPAVRRLAHLRQMVTSSRLERIVLWALQTHRDGCAARVAPPSSSWSMTTSRMCDVGISASCGGGVVRTHRNTDNPV